MRRFFMSPMSPPLRHSSKKTLDFVPIFSSIFLHFFKIFFLLIFPPKNDQTRGRGSPVRHAKFQSIRYFIDMDILQILLVDIDINIDIFRKCRYIDTFKKYRQGEFAKYRYR